jgi:hypothetical protein
MLYRTIVKPEAVEQLNEIRNKFNIIYAEHGIEVLGHWKNAGNPNETIYMVKYESETDYQNKIEELQEDEHYIHLTAKLNSIRTDFRPEKLVPA